MENAKELPAPLSQVDELADAVRSLDGTLVHLKRLNTIFKETQEMLTTFADHSREGIVLMQDNRFIWANKAASKITGYTFEELLAIPTTEATLPDYRDKLVARINMVLAGDPIPSPQEWPVFRKDRMVRWVRNFSYRVIYRGKPAVVSFFYDVSETKKTTEESMLRAAILDSINDEVILMELSGKIVYVNDAVCESLGYSKGDLLSMSILDITASENRDKAGIRLKQVSEHKEARFSTIGIRKDGTKFNIEVRARILKQGGKQYVLTVGREVHPDTNGETQQEKPAG